jgi:hypothetical protein
MSPDLASRSAYATNPAAERRVRLRYAVELDLRYKLTWRRQVLHEGSGKAGLGRPPDCKKADIENTSPSYESARRRRWADAIRRAISSADDSDRR